MADTNTCSVCGHRAPNKTALNRHMKTHTKKNFKKCAYCSYEGRSDTVKRHEHRAHKDQATKHMNPQPSKPLSNPIEPEPDVAEAVEEEPMDVDQPASTVELIEDDEESMDSDQPTSTVELIEDEPTDNSGEEESADDFKPEDYYSKVKTKETYSQKWKTSQSHFEFKIKPLPTVDWQQKLMQILEHLLTEVRSRAPADAIGRIVVAFDGLGHAINERACTIKEIDLKKLLDRIESVLNSNESVSTSNGIKVYMIFTEMPSGSGQGTRSFGSPGTFQGRSVLDPDSWSGKKSCLLNAAEGAEDNLCMARSLVAALGMADHTTLRDVDNTPVKLSTLKDGRKKAQTRRALKLHRDAGVIPIPNRCGLVELRKFQEHLSRYQIILYESGMLEPTYKGPEHKPMQLYLWLSNNHYQVINPKRIAALFAKDKYCGRCHQAYNRDAHLCNESECCLCCNPECDNRSLEKEKRTCDDCDLEYLSAGCFAVHKIRECALYVLCPNCLKRIKRKDLDPPGFKPDINIPQPKDSLHLCLQNYCRFCNQHYTAGFHTYCHVQKPKAKKGQQEIDEAAEVEDPINALLGERDMDRGYEDGPDGGNADGTCREAHDAKEEKETRLIFCDFETEKRDAFNDPVLLCLEEADGTRLEPYTGPNCAENFVRDCFKRPREDAEDNDGPAQKRRKKDNEDTGFSDVKFVFHNFSGFDGHLVLQEIHKQKIKPQTLFRGSRLLSMSLPQRKITFLDSALHCVMPLSHMPKAYGFPHESKGQFPYLLATEANRNYRGRFPAIDYFDPDRKTTKERKELLRWHAEKQKEYEADPTKIYDIQRENLLYCRQDCSILRQGFLKYRDCMMALFFGMSPTGFVTLPSYCNAVFRTHMMDENTIWIVPPHGYGSVKSSVKAVAWLEYQSFILGLPITHSRNSNEVSLGRYKIDGFARSKSGAGICFEYNGCFVHGDTCVKDRRKTFGGRTMDELRAYTLEKEEFIKRAGFQLVSVYECEVKEQRAKDREMRQALTILERRLDMERYPPLNPRDAFKGGRTSALRRMYIPKEGETLKYYDVTSLYPSINFSMQDQEWPISYPDVHLWNFPELQDTFGLIKCTVLPPDRLYLPVLGVTANSKLIFGLCGTCINTQGVTEYCTHSDPERYLSGTFVSEELKLAVSKGYRVVHVQEVWNWPRNRRSKTLFRPFIAAAYREKLEASGWPEDIKALMNNNDPLAEERKQQYMDEIKQQLGIEMRPEMVEYNSARRQAGKLLLNNFWGFWGKSPNQDVTKYIESLGEFYKLLNTKDVGMYFPANEDQMVMCYKDKKELEKPDPKSNVVLAAVTTAYARMRLYHFMDMVGDRCVYVDTDSVIWIDREGEPGIECDDLLGGMKDEVLSDHGPDATITAYAGLGSKTYTLQISNMRTGELIAWSRKMKGIRPSFQVDQLMTDDKMLDMVRNEYSIKVPQRNLRRNRKDVTLEWVEMMKEIKSTFSKRLPAADLEAPTDPIGTRIVTPTDL